MNNTHIYVPYLKRKAQGSSDAVGISAVAVS